MPNTLLPIKQFEAELKELFQAELKKLAKKSNAKKR
jgi:hypothetical protein